MRKYTKIQKYIKVKVKSKSKIGMWINARRNK